MLAKVYAKGNRIHIEKNRPSSKLLDKPVIDTTSNIGTILAAVRDQNLAYGFQIGNCSSSLVHLHLRTNFTHFPDQGKSGSQRSSMGQENLGEPP